MGAVDRRTAEQFGVPLAELMERAGRAVAEFCLRQYPTAESVLVLCGKGNNGGDGFVAARLLAKAKVMVRVVLLGQAHDVKGEAAGALKRMQEEASSAILDEVVDEAALRELWDSLDNTELFVDAVVGTGFKPPLRGLPAVLREMVANTAAPVVAVDPLSEITASVGDPISATTTGPNESLVKSPKHAPTLPGKCNHRIGAKSIRRG